MATIMPVFLFPRLPATHLFTFHVHVRIVIIHVRIVMIYVSPCSSIFSIRSSRFRMAQIIVLATCVFQLSHYLDAEPLLSCVTMGMLTVSVGRMEMRNHALSIINDDTDNAIR